MRRIVCFVPAVVLLVMAAAASGSTRSGVYGTLTRGPITPVCVAEQPCTAPVPNTAIRFYAAGTEHLVGQTRTGGDGRYRMVLPAGRYTVRVVPQRRLRTAAIRVPVARFVHLDLSIDTGIR
jgi:hypothetical protein